MNTDRELWRERPGDYYADSLHVTSDGRIGISCAGFVIVMPVREWHRLAADAGSRAPAEHQELHNAPTGSWTLTNPRLRGWRRWVVAFGAPFRPVRRLLGGHWENWYVEPCGGFTWIDTDRCSVTSGTRPPSCFGTPTCEDYSASLSRGGPQHG